MTAGHKEETRKACRPILATSPALEAALVRLARRCPDVVYAIRARTRAQIESTQIVRPRPYRMRGGPVEDARGTGDLASVDPSGRPHQNR